MLSAATNANNQQAEWRAAGRRKPSQEPQTRKLSRNLRVHDGPLLLKTKEIKNANTNTNIITNPR